MRNTYIMNFYFKKNTSKKHIFTQGDENRLKLIMCGILYLSFNDSHCHEAFNACAFTKYMRKTN